MRGLRPARARSERDMLTVTWAELLSAVVAAQRTTRLCIVKDLSVHDIASPHPLPFSLPTP